MQNTTGSSPANHLLTLSLLVAPLPIIYLLFLSWLPPLKHTHAHTDTSPSSIDKKTLLLLLLLLLLLTSPTSPLPPSLLSLSGPPYPSIISPLKLSMALKMFAFSVPKASALLVLLSRMLAGT